MKVTVAGSIFKSLFEIAGETAATLNASIYDENDALVTVKSIPKRDKGYLFSHVFTDIGVFTVRVTGTNLITVFDAVRVTSSVWEEPKGISLIDQLQLVTDMTTGRWKIDETTNEMIFFKDDGLTVVATYALKDQAGQPASESVFERIKI